GRRPAWRTGPRRCRSSARGPTARRLEGGRRRSAVAGGWATDRDGPGPRLPHAAGPEREERSPANTPIARPQSRQAGESIARARVDKVGGARSSLPAYARFSRAPRKTSIDYLSVGHSARARWPGWTFPGNSRQTATA